MLLDVTVLRIHKPHQFTMSNLPFGMKCFVMNMGQVQRHIFAPYVKYLYGL